MEKRKPRIVAMGGGTGTFTVLTGLKRYPADLAAIVAMADDGGSTGILRDELGVLPPGDVRQALVALSGSDRLMRKLMNYRFAEGGLKGHSFGNLFLSALHKVTGSFDAAVEKAGEILRINGRVIPATLADVALVAHFPKGKTIRGQYAIQVANLRGMTRLMLHPRAPANPRALRAIHNADLVVIGPGDLYSSIIPNLLVRGISEALRATRARVVYVANLMTKPGQTDGFSAVDFGAVVAQYMGRRPDVIVFNNRRPPARLMTQYAMEGEQPVASGNVPARGFLGADLVSRTLPRRQKGDPLPRTLIRHDSARLAALLIGLVRRGHP